MTRCNMDKMPNDVFQKCYEYERLDQVMKSGLYPYFIPLGGFRARRGRYCGDRDADVGL